MRLNINSMNNTNKRERSSSEIIGRDIVVLKVRVKRKSRRGDATVPFTRDQGYDRRHGGGINLDRHHPRPASSAFLIVGQHYG